MNKNLRKEFDRLRNKGILAEQCGTVCVCCGAMESIAYHHILPLAMGGDNRASNIVPICDSCHGKIHGTNMMCLSRYSTKTGRPKDKAPDGYRELSIKYIRNEITGKEMKEICSLDKGARVAEKWWFKETLESEGIVAYKKVTGKYKGEKKGVVSRIWYKDGGYKEIVYMDGEYKEEYVADKYTEEEVKKLKETSGVYRPDRELEIASFEDYWNKFSRRFENTP